MTPVKPYLINLPSPSAFPAREGAISQEFSTISQPTDPHTTLHTKDLAARLAQQVEILDRAASPRFVHAPGRINVIGEHTDTSGGLSLPAAVDRGLLLAFAPASRTGVSVVSLDMPGRVELDAHLALVPGSAPFGPYVAAVAAELASRGVPVPGVVIALGSTIPRGGGMSSSAALCVALTLALSNVAGATLPPLDVALVAQAAEHRVGVRCGLMDQYASVHGKAGHALLFDSRAQRHDEIPLELGEFVLVVGDTKAPRGLVDSEYNARRSQVEEAARLLDDGSGRIASLRDATVELVKAKRSELGALLYRRAMHVVEENERTRAAAQLLRAPRIDTDPPSTVAALGRLLDASHASLRDLFEVSCPELDALVTALTEQGSEFVPGARMMGGGFGGCVIALAERASLPAIIERATATYRAQTGKDAAFFPVEIGPGAALLPPPS